MELRSYQRDAADEMFACAVAREKKLFVAPTGSGKTVIAAAAINKMITSGIRVLFVAHTKEIVLQTRRKLIEAGVAQKNIGVVMASVGDKYENANARVQVCSVQTLVAREHKPDADVVFVDEAHHATAGRYETLRSWYTGAVAYIGLTATPKRFDGKGFDDVFDSLTVVAQPSQLIADGHLAAPIIFGAPANVEAEIKKQLRGVSRPRGDYAPGELGRVMNTKKLIGNVVTEWKRLSHNHATVVFASSVKHSQALAKRFNRAGVKAEHLDGTTTPEDRDALLKRLSNGQTKVVTNYAVLSEGWDQPSVKCIVLARPTRSLTVYMQQAGRGLRPWRKQTPIIIDHALVAKRFGYPDVDRAHTLEGRPVNDNGGADETQSEELHKTCTECLRVIPLMTSNCPFCGASVERPETPEEINARLEQLKREREASTLKVGDVVNGRTCAELGIRGQHTWVCAKGHKSRAGVSAVKKIASCRQCAEYIKGGDVVNGRTVVALQESNTSHLWECAQAHRVLASVRQIKKHTCRKCKQMQIGAVFNGRTCVELGIRGTHTWLCAKGHSVRSSVRQIKKHTCIQCKRPGATNG